MRNIADVGEVEEILVVAELEVGFAFFVCVVHVWNDLHVAFTKDSGWSNGGCEQCWGGRGAVGC